jgi:dihydroxyacid dehydratase/phosphogluconate dehydratase
MLPLHPLRANKPFIAIVTTASDTTPCNGTLAEQAAHAHEGVLSAGGTPRAFTTISVPDGISMNHQGMKCSLLSYVKRTVPIPSSPCRLSVMMPKR